ncbi:MAG: FkbM family methyltransferase [Burkholderiales bacterium]
MRSRSADPPRPSRMFQAAFDRLLALPVGSTSRMLLFRALRRLYRSLAKGRNVLVTYSVDGCEIYFPALHETPFHWKFMPDNSKSLGRIAMACAGNYPESVIVDVGANVGDSAAIIRSRGVRNRIISVEGVAEFHDVLVRNAELLGDVTPVLAFVAASEHRAAANLRVVPGGNAVVYENPDDFGIRAGSLPMIDGEFLKLEQVVGQHAPGATVKLLKTDIEGYDLPVLNGSLEFIARHRPLVYLELHVSGQDEQVRGVSWRDLWSNLRELGYAQALYWYNSDDFLCMLDLNRDDHVIRDIHDYFRNRSGRLYLDVCLIHGEDAALAETVYAGEKLHAQALRG